MLSISHNFAGFIRVLIRFSLVTNKGNSEVHVEQNVYVLVFT
jgi:hypothetical protein